MWDVFPPGYGCWWGTSEMKQALSSRLSKHLFWDVDAGSLDAERNKKLIIHRVLDYGTLSDWQLIHECYGIGEIAQTAITIKDLDAKSASFVALLSGTPKDRFSCYTTKQSTPKHWIYHEGSVFLVLKSLSYFDDAETRIQLCLEMLAGVKRKWQLQNT